MKTSALLLPLFAFAVRVLADVPPACLLSAVNTQDEPSDLSKICGKEATDVQEAIASLCGSTQSVAQSAFIATCSGAGSSVAPYTATSTSTKSHTTGASSSAGAATSVTSSATVTATATSSGEGSSATGNAAADVKQVGSFAAAAIAIAGVVAIL